MDAIQLIKNDHAEVDALFVRFEAAHRGGDVGEQARLARAIVRALSIHAAIEEQLVYPSLREAGVEDDVLEALEEHHLVKLTLAELDGLPAEDGRFAAKVRVLIENVRQHVQEEEAELLPRLRRSLSNEQLTELGDALATAKLTAPTRPHPAAPDEPPGVFVAGALSALLDRSRDALREGAAMLRAVATRGARRGMRAARRAERRGREAAVEVREAGRERLERARNGTARVADRVEHRAAEAARTVQSKTKRATRTAQRRGKNAVKDAEKRGRAATRGYQGAPRAVKR
ncbi:MAG: hemerythrin domain-containing protein [Anaeromyxobacteraceae bacterium]